MDPMVSDYAWWSFRWRVRHAGLHPLRWLALAVALVMRKLTWELWESAPAGSKLIITPWHVEALLPECDGRLTYLMNRHANWPRLHALAQRYPWTFTQAMSMLAYGEFDFYTET